jgi:hypothetical protein
MPKLTQVCYYYGVPYDGGFIELVGEDGTPMRDIDPKELKRLWLDEAKKAAAENLRNLYFVKETLELEEV